MCGKKYIDTLTLKISFFFPFFASFFNLALNSRHAGSDFEGMAKGIGVGGQSQGLK